MSIVVVRVRLLLHVAHAAIRTLAVFVDVFAFDVLLPDVFVAFADVGAVCVAAAVGKILFFAAWSTMLVGRIKAE